MLHSHSQARQRLSLMQRRGCLGWLTAWAMSWWVHMLCRCVVIVCCGSCGHVEQFMLHNNSKARQKYVAEHLLQWQGCVGWLAAWG
jgi:hypothetical protein